MQAGVRRDMGADALGERFDLRLSALDMTENALAALAIPATLLQAIDFLLPHALQVGAAQHQVLQQLHFGWGGTPSRGTLLFALAHQHFGIVFIGRCPRSCERPPREPDRRC